MLTHLHVKNLALIREAEIDFTEGLNILTGETGAGKSIVIGSVSLALGGRVAKDMVRPGADYGLAELVFLVNRKKQREKLLELGITPEDDTVIISRKILEGRSINKINGETVTLSQLKEAAALLIDIHGQHDSQMLLQTKKHLEILDSYAADSILPKKEKMKAAWKKYAAVVREIEENALDESSRKRQGAETETRVFGDDFALYDCRCRVVVGQRQVQTGQHVFRGAGCEDTSLFKQDKMVCQRADFFKGMADVKYGDAEFFVETLEIGDDFRFAFHVECGQRLIHEHDVRAGRQRACDADTLFFAA